MSQLKSFLKALARITSPATLGALRTRILILTHIVISIIVLVQQCDALVQVVKAVF